MLGGRKKLAQERAQTPRLRALVDKVRAMQQEAKAVVPTGKDLTNLNNFD